MQLVSGDERHSLPHLQICQVQRQAFSLAEIHIVGQIDTNAVALHVSGAGQLPTSHRLKRICNYKQKHC